MRLYRGASCMMGNYLVQFLGGRKAQAFQSTRYLLTNIQDITPESLAKIVQDYLNRWKVEEYIRFIKQQYNAERFQVLSLGRIKNLFHLLYMAVVILTRVKEIGIEWKSTKAILLYKARRTYKIPKKMKFHLYSLADGLAEVLRISPKRVKQIWVRRPNPYQLSLFDSRTII